MHLLTCVHKQSTTISPWMQTEAPKLQGRSREHSPGRRVALWLQRRSPRSGPRSAELPFTHMFPPGMRTQTLASPRPPPPGRRVAPMTADLPLGCRFASGLQIRPWAADLPRCPGGSKFLSKDAELLLPVSAVSPEAALSPLGRLLHLTTALPAVMNSVLPMPHAMCTHVPVPLAR